MISWELGIKTSFAISDDDANEIKQLLDIKSHPELRQEQKEEQIFSMVHNSFITEQNGENILKYLIFDYKINENIARKAVTHDFNSEGIIPEVQKMFDTRKLRDTLNTDLKSIEGKKKALKL